MFQLDVVDLIRNRCFLKNEISEAELHSLIGIFAVNGFNMDSKGVLGKALFPVFSVVNHDCVGNSKVQVVPSPAGQLQPRVVLKATRDIGEGEEITVQYTNREVDNKTGDFLYFFATMYRTPQYLLQENRLYESQGSNCD